MADDVVAALKASGLLVGARDAIRTSIRTAGAANRNWCSVRWTNGSSAWTGATASRAHCADHPVDSARGRSARAGLAAQHARLDDFQEALLGTRAAHLGVRRVRAFHGDRQPRGVAGPRGRGLGDIRRQFAAPSLYGRGEDPMREVRRHGLASGGRGQSLAGRGHRALQHHAATVTDRAYWEKWFPADLVLESFPASSAIGSIPCWQ